VCRESLKRPLGAIPFRLSGREKAIEHRAGSVLLVNKKSESACRNLIVSRLCVLSPRLEAKCVKPQQRNITLTRKCRSNLQLFVSEPNNIRLRREKGARYFVAAGTESERETRTSHFDNQQSRVSLGASLWQTNPQ
jgi:hypothetical protein